MDGNVLESEINIDDVKYTSSILERLNCLRREGKHCDFIVKIGDEDIPVHRNVVAASSEYFRAMLEHDTIEKKQGFVEIEDADGTSVKKCMDFIYTGKASISEDKIDGLMYVAYLMQLKELCDGITDLLQTWLNAKTFFHIKRLANLYNCKELEEVCDKFAKGNFNSISLDEDFKALSQNYITWLIGSEETQAAECDKFNALVDWIHHDSTNRKKLFKGMLKQIDVCNISASHRRFIVENEPMVHDSAECLKIFLSSFFESVQVTARQWDAAGGNNTIALLDQTANCLRYLEPSSGKWEYMQEVDDTMKNQTFSAVTLNGYIYALMSDGAVYRLFYLNAKATWQRMADMTENHGHLPNATVLRDSIYIVGASNRMNVSNEKFCPSENIWTTISDRNTPRCNSSVAVVEELTYSIGGWNNEPMTRRVPFDGRRRVAHQPGPGRVYKEAERFNPMTLEWSYVAPMLHARHSAAAVEFNGKIYVAGGSDGQHILNTVEFYDPGNDTWTDIITMASCRHNFTASVLSDRLIVVGGSSNSDTTAEILDPEAKEWDDVDLRCPNLLTASCVAFRI